MKKKQLVGIGIFILLVLIIICVQVYSKKTSTASNENLKTVTVATGGGKEDFIADEDVNRILREKYGLNVIYDSWSNGKLIVNPLVRENGDKYD